MLSFLAASRLTRMIRPLSLASAIGLALCLPGVSALAQTITYQGQLKSSGTPYNGSADLRFTLYNAASGGSIMGGPLAVNGATIDNGTFTTQLNFGPTAFDGTARWIFIEVHTPSNGGSGPYTALSPRQAVTSAPYALYAMNALTPFTFSGTNGIFSGTGNVGIGTSTPTGGKFVVQTAASNYGMLQTDGTRTMGTWVGPSGGWLGTLSNDSLNFGTNNVNGQMVLTTGGNLGLGNNAPDGRLHLTGGPVWTSNGWTKSLTLNAAAAIELGKGNPTRFGVGSSQNGFYLFHTGTDATDQAADYDMVVDSLGHVAFNMNAATNAPLAVAGAANEWAFYSTSTGANGFGIVSVSNGQNGRGIEGQCSVDGLGATIGVHGSGNYGILGTANEGVLAFGTNGDNGLYGTTSGSTLAAGVYGTTTTSNSNGVIGEANTGTAAYGVWGRAAQGYGGYFEGGNYAIYAVGRVRVGTIEIAGGADLAEPFAVSANGTSDDQIKPGMVVVIDPASPGHLKLSSSAYDAKVAGVISGANELKPGMVMKSEGTAMADGDHPVALTGRVWCWCDAGASAIEPGDMLTTSDTPGHAMKASDRERRDGAVIGKAMTPLAHGEKGLVLVLVNLQ